MSPAAESLGTVVCARCGAVIEGCAFCEDDRCGAPLCYRCVRIALAQEVRQPHAHGG